MNALFYKRDVLEEYGQKGEKREVKDVVFFRLEVPPLPGTAEVPYIYDQKATAEHIKSYHNAYQKFLKSDEVQEVKEIVKETKKVSKKKVSS